MITSFYGTKIDTAQAFDDKGRRIVVTNLKVKPITVTQIKSAKTDGYKAVQVAIGTKSKKSQTRALAKHLKGAKLDKAPLFIREIKVEKDINLKVGDQIKIADVFNLNDQLKVTGTSKGKGFAGVIKRWGFAGGPKTHGQSDRERAPGSIGQRSDPGRVWKGKKMAGHLGSTTKAVTNLQIISLDSDHYLLQVSGTIPGARHGLIKLTKTGSAKRPIKLKSDKVDVKLKPKK